MGTSPNTADNVTKSHRSDPAHDYLILSSIASRPRLGQDTHPHAFSPSRPTYTFKPNRTPKTYPSPETRQASRSAGVKAAVALPNFGRTRFSSLRSIAFGLFHLYLNSLYLLLSYARLFPFLPSPILPYSTIRHPLDVPGNCGTLQRATLADAPALLADDYDTTSAGHTHCPTPTPRRYDTPF